MGEVAVLAVSMVMTVAMAVVVVMMMHAWNLRVRLSWIIRSRSYDAY